MLRSTKTLKKVRSERGWSNLAEKGLSKYVSLSSSAMAEYAKKYRATGGKTGNSEKFYEYVARARLRSK